MKLTSDSRNALARGQQLYRHALLELLAVTWALGCDRPLASRRANLTREALYRRYRIARDALLVPLAPPMGFRGSTDVLVVLALSGRRLLRVGAFVARQLLVQRIAS